MYKLINCSQRIVFDKNSFSFLAKISSWKNNKKEYVLIICKNNVIKNERYKLDRLKLKPLKKNYGLLMKRRKKTKIKKIK